MARQRPPTPAQRRLLLTLAKGWSIVDADYQSHATPGRPSRVENTLIIMANRGWIDWPYGVSEIAITAAGRSALKKGSPR